MIFFLCVIIGSLLLTWLNESCFFEEELEMRRLIKESRENERKRMIRRKSYGQCGWMPPR